MTVFDKISIRIIKEQELIIGPVAWEEAKKVPGFRVINQQVGEVAIDGDAKVVLDKLVAQYTRLFGKLSEEVCKEVVQDLLVELPPDQVPMSLR